MKIEELIKQLDAESFNQTPEGWRPIRHAKYELESVKAALDKSGTAIGNEHETYSLAKRVENLTTERDYFMRQCDEARAKLKASAEPANIQAQR